MSKKRIVWGVVVLAVAGGIVTGVLVWRLDGPSGPARKLVGGWDVVHSETKLDEAVAGVIEKKEPNLAAAVGDKFRSTERIHFDRSGAFRFTQDFAGMSILEEGTWQVTEKSDGNILVKIHKTKLSLRNPEKGETKEDGQDATIEWVVAVVNPDQLSVTMTNDDGKIQSFVLGRAKD